MLSNSSVSVTHDSGRKSKHGATKDLAVSVARCLSTLRGERINFRTELSSGCTNGAYRNVPTVTVKVVVRVLFAVAWFTVSWNAQGQSARSSLGETLAWLRGKTHYFYWFSNPNPNAQDAVCNVTQDPIEFTGCAIRWKQESNCGGLFERRQDLSHIDISQISAARTSDDRWRVVGVPEWSQSEDIVKRAVVAIRHAAMLCGAKPEPF